jgi:hypothetical protein
MDEASHAIKDHADRHFLWDVTDRTAAGKGDRDAAMGTDRLGV